MWKSIFKAQSNRRPVSGTSRAFRPRVELLEDRSVPSTITPISGSTSSPILYGAIPNVIDGVIDYDSYLGLGPQKLGTFQGPYEVRFDLGGSYDLTAMNLWNNAGETEHDGEGIDSFSLVFRDQNSLPIGFFDSNASDTLARQSFTFSASKVAFVDLVIYSNHSPTLQYPAVRAYVDFYEINFEGTGTTDIYMISAQLQAGNTVQYAYETTGNPGPFEVGLYRSADGVSYDPADQIATQTVTPSPTNPQTPGTFTLPGDFSAQGKPYLIVVADPSDLISESNPNNNKASLGLPDAVAVSLNATQLTARDYLFTYSYIITGSDLPADTRMTFFWSDNETFESDRDAIAFDFPIQGSDREVGVYSGSLILRQPPGKRYLLLVLDPPVLGGSQGQLMEADETNNVKAVRLVGADLPDVPGGDDDDLPPGAKFPNLDERLKIPFTPGLPGGVPRGLPF